MEEIAIVVVGYNKIDSLQRLLDSLNNADYMSDKVPLIISLDNCGSDKVERFAKKYKWNHGSKRIRTFNERQGLRNHILSCGDFLDEYEAIYVFEDDIMVSPAFYKFGKKCIEFYKDDENIEGISLYARQWHQNSHMPFTPLKSGYDTYFAQAAQSWGQIWFSDRWKKFKKWYEENQNIYKETIREDIPKHYYTWDEKSWLKFHMAYCILNKKYFVYPYFSFTTAFVEAGTHFFYDNTIFQSNMTINGNEKYKLAYFGKDTYYYDAFFENMQLNNKLDDKYGRHVVLDLYGAKLIHDNMGIVISTQMLPYKIIDEYALQLRPIELNIFMDVKGTGIYVYDTHIKANRKKSKVREQVARKWNYFMYDRFLLKEEMLSMLIFQIKNQYKILKKKYFSKHR